eukprot:CAMPEP_0181318620 /NCGR_PEP_ID=MMETSP1101-20121128/17106_1 /TAXON_ID=46948 /ORGANISM="Rhodomonas abbreviata, Strain Caron Lab Isolate" /LENGTH=371 /DNA_ID=CAMNT_0023426107 /DNA_START=71 /DNA_END=1186 /DNA_ORIENTATION=-
MGDTESQNSNEVGKDSVRLVATPSTGFVFQSEYMYELTGEVHPLIAEGMKAASVPASREECVRAWAPRTAQSIRDMYRPALARFLACDPAKQALEQVVTDSFMFEGVHTLVHRPVSLPNRVLPALVYLHGGGGFMGSAEDWQHCCARLSSEAGVVVVNVNYRLAPENPFPAALIDVEKVVRGVVAEAEKLGVDPDKIALGGDSAGGHHAVAVARRLARGGEGQLIKLVLAMSAMETKMFRESPFEELVGTERDAAGLMGLCDRCMSGEDENRLEQLISSNELHPMVLNTGEAEKELPPTLVVTSEFDFLRRPSEEFAKVLKDAGKLADFIVYPGTPHVFWLNMNSPLAGDVYRHTAEVIKKVLFGVALESS